MPPPDDAKLDPIARLRQLPMRHRWLRWVVLAFSLAFAAGSSYFFYLGILEEGRLRFGRTALSVGRDLDARIRAYEDVLYAMRGLFDAADQVTRDDFHEFAEALAIPKRYPGVTNLNFAERLSGGQKQAFERTVRAEKSRLTEGLPEFSIKPPGERPEYLVLNYIEPLARSAIVWGNDLNADPQRRSALQRARDTGQVASTSGITLQSDAKSRVTSLLFRLAVYHGKGVPNTIEDRQRLYRGMVGSTIRIGEMVEAALPGQTLKRARVIIHEGGEVSGGGTNPDPGALLYDSEAGGSAPAATDYSAYAVTQHLSLADRKWQLDIVPLLNPVNPLNHAAVAVVFAVSIAASALLFWLMGSVATSASRSAELAKTNEALHVENAERKRAEEKAAQFYAMVDNSTEYVSMASPDGKVFYLNPAGRRMSGIAQDADVSAINWRDFFDDENWRLRLETALPTLRATGHWEGEIRMRNLETGKMLDLLVHAFKVEDPRTKAPLCIATVQRDITERKRAEETLHRSETKFRTLYDSSSDAVMLLDQKAFFDCNPATLAMFGCATQEELCTKHPADLSPPVQPDGTDSQALAGQRIAAAMEKGSIRFEWMHKRADTGETFPADVLLTAMTLDDKPVLQAVVRDVTVRKRIEADLHRFRAELEQRIADATTANNSLLRQTEELRRLNEERAALANMNELLTACASPDEAYEIFGRAATGLFPSLSGALHIFAASRNQLTPAATWGTWPGAAMPAAPESCWGLRRGQYYVGNGTTTPPCGHAGPARGLATLCVPLAAYGEVLGVLHLRGPDAAAVQSALQLAAMAGDGLALNVANLRLRESLKAQSIRDPLTELFNRRYLTETLEREFARAQRSGAPVAVMMLDVDHFKRFNDNFGHDAGDAVLRELGKFLRRSARAEDIACRYGGEEFCLVLPGMGRDGARQRAEAIREGTARLEVRSGDRVLEPVTLSLGVALFPEDAKTIASVLAAADAFLYQAKREGRNRVVMSAATGTAGVTAAADTSTV